MAVEAETKNGTTVRKCQILFSKPVSKLVGLVFLFSV